MILRNAIFVILFFLIPILGMVFPEKAFDFVNNVPAKLVLILFTEILLFFIICILISSKQNSALDVIKTFITALINLIFVPYWVSAALSSLKLTASISSKANLELSWVQQAADSSSQSTVPILCFAAFFVLVYVALAISPYSDKANRRFI